MTQPKKPYSAPKIFEVELNQDQAILTTCSSGVTNASVRRTTSCVAATCKRSTSAGDSAAHPS